MYYLESPKATLGSGADAEDAICKNHVVGHRDRWSMFSGDVDNSVCLGHLVR